MTEPDGGTDVDQPRVDCWQRSLVTGQEVMGRSPNHGRVPDRLGRRDEHEPLSRGWKLRKPAAEVLLEPRRERPATRES